MNLSPLLHALGALASIGAAYAINAHCRPEFEPRYEAREYAEATGTLSLSPAAGNLEIPLMTTHVVTQDVIKLGRVYQIRELTLRAAANGGATPSLELFANLSGLGGDLQGGAHDPTVLLQTELPLAPAGRLGARRSYVMLDGRHPYGIATGNLMLTEIVQGEGGTPPAYRAEGRLEVQVETDHGIEMLTGRVSGRISWDEPAAPQH